MTDDIYYAYFWRFNKKIVSIIIIAKINLIAKLKDQLAKITNLALTPQMMIIILKLAIYPKLSFDFKIYDFSHTWISNELDSLVHYHLRKWLELPVRTCVEEIVRLPTKKCDLNLISLKEYAESFRTIARHSLKNSADCDMKQLWHDTTVNNIATDARLNNDKPLRAAKKEIKLEYITLSIIMSKHYPCREVSLTQSLTSLNREVLRAGRK